MYKESSRPIPVTERLENKKIEKIKPKTKANEMFGKYEVISQLISFFL